MANHLWIRSPGCSFTLEQACERYNNFLKLFKFYPKQLMVPTLDIDLAWHTHQLSARQYRNATERICGRFIDHNDKLGQSSLDLGFMETRRLYAIRFGAEYDRCLCWEDQALEGLLRKDTTNADIGTIGKQAADDVAYHYAVEVARRAGQQLPVRA
jgi:hypothetical protein